MTGQRHAYSIDLLATDSAVAHKALSGEPILIYPKGTHHRPNPFTGQPRVWTVDDAIVQQVIDNYAHRTERGIRQARLPVNVDHSGSRALGWFDRVVALPDGVGATFRWNRKGREALEEGEFSYFSVEVWDKFLDHVTGETVYNQIGGGALTNYPFFGEATSLMSLNLPAGGDPMTQTIEQIEAERNWLQNLLHSLFARSDTTGGTPPALTPGVPEEFRKQFEQLQTQVGQLNTQLQGERESYAQQIQALQGQLSTVQEARATERFSVLAEGFAHLPAATNELAAQLRWLHEADQDGTHRDFFTRLLRTADEQFARYFRELGVRGSANAGDAETQIETHISQYMSTHQDATYRDALDVVLREHPELEQLYHREFEGGA